MHPKEDTIQLQRSFCNTTDASSTGRPVREWILHGNRMKSNSEIDQMPATSERNDSIVEQMFVSMLKFGSDCPTQWCWCFELTQVNGKKIGVRVVVKHEIYQCLCLFLCACFQHGVIPFVSLCLVGKFSTASLVQL